MDFGVFGLRGVDAPTVALDHAAPNEHHAYEDRCLYIKATSQEYNSPEPLTPTPAAPASEIL